MTAGDRQAMPCQHSPRIRQLRLWACDAIWVPCAFVALSILTSISSCSSLNREGPFVTCSDLDGGTTNACRDGIIASCINGATVTYEVCIEGEAPEDICEQSWQMPGHYRCENESARSSGSASASSGGTTSSSGGASSSSGGSSTSPISISCGLTLACSNARSPASAYWFDYDDGNEVVGSTSVETTATGAISCTPGHRICFGGSVLVLQGGVQQPSTWGVCDVSYGSEACQHPVPVGTDFQYCWTCAANADCDVGLSCN